MTDRLVMSFEDVQLAAERVADEFARVHDGSPVRVYGVPRGGVLPAYMVADVLLSCGIQADVTFDRVAATLFVDDIYDSGATAAELQKHSPDVPLLVLFNKRSPRYAGKWLVMPWEDQGTGGPDDAVMRLLQFVGEDPSREGLRDTPARFLRALEEYTSGYGKDPADVLRVFEDGAERYDEMVLVGPVHFFSLCEHHLAPFFGQAYIGYVPTDRIVGLSKLARLTEIFARRLQVQERMTRQIGDALVENLNPLGTGVVLRARHLCMESRGVKAQGAVTTTSALYGVLRDRPSARAEFLAFVRASVNKS